MRSESLLFFVLGMLTGLTLVKVVEGDKSRGAYLGYYEKNDVPVSIPSSPYVDPVFTDPGSTGYPPPNDYIITITSDTGQNGDSIKFNLSPDSEEDVD